MIGLEVNAGHDHLETTKFRVVPFRGDKLDMMVQRGNLAVCRFRGDELNMTDGDATKFRILPFRGDKLDIMTRMKSLYWTKNRDSLV